MDFKKKIPLVTHDVTYPFDINYLPEEYHQKAEKDLNETSESRTRSILQLKLMLNDENSTKAIHFHEDFLCQFLRQNKYDVPKTFKRVQNFVNFRRKNSTYFQNLDIDTFATVPDHKSCTVLPWRCREGCTIVLFEMGKWQPKHLSRDDVLRITVLTFHQALRHPLSQINGFKVICDYKDASLRQITCMSPQIMYALYQAILDCTPARIKEIHMVNESLPMKAMWAVFKHFLSEKLRNRFLFHNSPEDLLTYFPKHALPEQYGGDLSNYYMETWMKEANRQQKCSTIHGQDNFF
ncbi:hypothetical protein JTE90_028168 [Oedothorax gibbosus]|uniref:CRAL-TRIO domain-containing protein n=1 Tax=Oedothorax gibbosus TaxID=931172 RepID=A0AAV6V9T0_9ARAC|nr:hypothetical protein JTE90_028168 [Oedothorax gibbosus]